MRFAHYRVSIKGPLSTPVGGGIRSLNVTLRQVLDLYACVRPVRYFEGVPSPVKEPGKVDMVIFRENTEDVYAGIEWPAESEGARNIIGFVNAIERRGGSKIREGSAIGIKPVSEFGSKRLVRKAIEYAIAAKRDSVTLVHKGNIMKFTEGGVQRLGLPACARGVRRRHDSGVRGWRGRRRRQDRHQGSHRRLDVPAGAAAAERSTRSSPRRTSTATISPTPSPRRSAASAWRRARTNRTK